MIWAFVVISAAFVGTIAYLGVRLVRVLEALVNVLNKRQGSRSYSTPAPTEVATTTTERKVEELPPQVIAPNLFKPPRPRGGFGSTVRTDDDLQVQQGNSGEEGSEGGEIGDATDCSINPNAADPGPADPGNPIDSSDSNTGTGTSRRRG